MARLWTTTISQSRGMWKSNRLSHTHLHTQPTVAWGQRNIVWHFYAFCLVRSELLPFAEQKAAGNGSTLPWRWTCAKIESLQIHKKREAVSRREKKNIEAATKKKGEKKRSNWTHKNLIFRSAVHTHTPAWFDCGPVSRGLGSAQVKPWPIRVSVSEEISRWVSYLHPDRLNTGRPAGNPQQAAPIRL